MLFIAFLLSLLLFLFLVDYANAACKGKTYEFKCGDKVNESCTMDRDESARGDCFTIADKNIVLDCSNFMIEGNESGIGIKIERGLNNITIKNCIILRFNEGIYAENSSNITIFNNFLRNNSAMGIFITYCNYTNITYNTVYENGYENGKGIYMEHGSGNVINNNTIQRSTYGIELFEIANSNITFNEVYENSRYDFYLRTVSWCRLDNNLAHNSRGGFFLESNSSYNTLDNNTAYNETSSGFNIAFGTYNNLTNNKAHDNNNGFGLSTNPSASGPTNNNLLMNNEAYNNTGDGFKLSSGGMGTVDENTLFNNTAYYNNDNGFNLGSWGGSVRNNNLTNNIRASQPIQWLYFNMV